LGRPRALEVGPRAVIIEVVCALDPLAEVVELFVADLAVDEDAAVGVPAEAFVAEDALVLLVQEGNALVVA
jgi:hypothetical protein